MPPAYEDLIERHGRELMRYAARLTGNREDALDLFQEIWLRAYRAYPRLTANGNYRAWLYTIATNLHRNQLRERARRSRVAAAQNRESRHDGSGIQGSHDGAVIAAGHLRSLIARLPHKQRSALLMRQLGGLEYEEIGEALGCSAESARANFSQALRKLREAW